jgi:Predicted transcriptional regulators
LNNLKKIRKEAKITIKKISQKLGITESYYWKIENGKRKLYYELAIKIAHIFNKKPDELFYKDY